jgi:hypothetical protein
MTNATHRLRLGRMARPFTKLSELARRAGLSDDALITPTLAVLTLAVVPFIWSILGLLISIFSPVHGILDGVMKVADVWLEGRDKLTAVREGTYFTELKTLYGLALYAGLAVAAIALVVAGLAYASTRLPATWARPLEVAAVSFWTVPYWLYRAFITLIFAAVIVGLCISFVLAFIATIHTYGIFGAILGAIFVCGLLGIGAPIAYLGFHLAYGPVYLLLRYVAPLGLVCAAPNGVGNRWLKRAFAEGRHFPFWNL